jgi:hypothetical protein
MIAEYIPLIISTSQTALRAIEQRTLHNDTKREELKKHYKKHSEQLATALLQWCNELNFSTG